MGIFMLPTGSKLPPLHMSNWSDVLSSWSVAAVFALAMQRMGNRSFMLALRGGWHEQLAYCILYANGQTSALD